MSYSVISASDTSILEQVFFIAMFDGLCLAYSKQRSLSHFLVLVLLWFEQNNHKVRKWFRKHTSVLERILAVGNVKNMCSLTIVLLNRFEPLQRPKERIIVQYWAKTGPSSLFFSKLKKKRKKKVEGERMTSSTLPYERRASPLVTHELDTSVF